MEIDEAVRACLEYIDAHLDEPLTPEGLAAHFHFSETHFRRCFQDYVGLSIGKYIRIARTGSAAQELMRRLSVKSVAAKYGYETLSGFSRAFEKVYGVPPSSYRGDAARGLPVIECFAPITLACYALRSAEDGETGLALWHGWDFSGVDPADFERASPEGGAEIGLWAELDGQQRYLFGVTCAEDAAIPEGMLRYTLAPATYAMFAVPQGEDTAQLWENINTVLDASLRHCGDAKAYAASASQPCLEYYHKTDVYICVPIRARAEDAETV